MSIIVERGVSTRLVACVLAVLREAPLLSAKEISQNLHYDERYVRACLRLLLGRGIVKAVPSRLEYQGKRLNASMPVKLYTLSDEGLRIAEELNARFVGKVRRAESFIPLEDFRKWGAEGGAFNKRLSSRFPPVRRLKGSRSG
jgi:predicted transcriptional regulator